MKFGSAAVALAALTALTAWTLPTATDAAPSPDPVKGKKLFQATCAGCHPGGGNVVNPKDPLKGPRFAREFADDKKLIGVVRTGIKGSAMPPFNQKQVSDPDLKDIIAYIRTLTPKGN